ncbi:MAG: hypothetical protein LBO09_06435 [Candidatus Peribacteria bacterium]|jgi:hypothetical protein|nr:hypothetical protein [Candidatus Peribacteria bacterium]
MRNNANPIVEQEKKDWKTELAKLGTDIFSLPIESMEIIKDQTPKQYQYYTLFWYANTRRF